MGPGGAIARLPAGYRSLDRRRDDLDRVVPLLGRADRGDRRPWLRSAAGLGGQVVRDGRALAFDHAEASGRLELAQRRAIEKVPRLDWAGRTATEIMPP